MQVGKAWLYLSREYQAGASDRAHNSQKAEAALFRRARGAAHAGARLDRRGRPARSSCVWLCGASLCVGAYVAATPLECRHGT